MFFAIVFAVWQPVWQLLDHSLFGRPLPFHSMREWWSFSLTNFIGGALVGAALSFARGREEGWWRDWLEMLPFVTLIDLSLSARAYIDDPLPQWVLAIAVPVLVTATLFTFVYQFVKGALRTAAGK